MLITDQMAAPFLFFCNVQNIIFQDLHIRYNQPLNGSYMANQNVNAMGTWVSVASNFQTQYLGGSMGYLQQIDGVQYANGGTPLWSGPSALTALFNMRGNCTNITFDRCTIDVPAGVSPAAFIFTLVNYCPEWAPNSTVIGYQSSGVSASYNSGTGLVTVTKSGAFSSPFVVGNKYWFYVSGFASSGPGSYNASQILVTIATTSTFTYPLTTNPGTVTTNGGFGSQTISGVTTNAPANITWKDCYFDGVMMGHVQTAQVNFLNCTWNRYSDLQDGTNGVVTFATAPANLATTATLAAPWPYPTATYWVTLGNTQMLGMLLTYNSTAAGNVSNPFIDAISGLSATVVGQMVATAAPANGATSMVLTGWTLGVAIVNPISVLFTNSTNDVRSVTVTTVSPYTTFTANWTTPLTSVCTSATQTIQVGTAATSGNIGGLPGPGQHGYTFAVNPYSAPPHAVYLGSLSGSYPAYVIAKNCVDFGVRVWNSPYSRNLSTSGNACSFKCELGRGSVVDGWTSYRPDGGLDLQGFSGTLGSSVSNCEIYFNSATNQTDFINNAPSLLPGYGAVQGVPVFGVRMPGPSAYNNIALSDIKVYDANPSPLQIPFIGTNYAPNNNISATGIKVFLGDFGTPGNGPLANTPEPSIQMGGTNITLDAEIYYDSFSSTNTSIGTVTAQAPTQNANCWTKHFGYRTPAITLTAPLVNANTAYISQVASTPQAPGCYVGGWPFGSGNTYKVIFADNSVRYCTITNTGTYPNATLITMMWPGAGVTASSSQLTGITAQGLYYQNFNTFGGYKPRLALDMNGGQTGSRYRVEDYSNQYFQDSIDNLVTETFGDSQACVLASGSTSFTTNLTIFGSLYLTAIGVNTTVAIVGNGGLTGYTVGWSGSNAVIAAATSLSANQPGTTLNPSSITSIANAAYGTNRTITITAVGGSFVSGTIQIAFKVQGSFMGY